MRDENIAEDFASQDMQNQFNNMMAQNQMYGNALSGEIGRGEGAAGNIANLFNQLGKNMAALQTHQGAAQGEENEANMSGKNSAVGDVLGFL
jgi:hypothetical protein